MGVPTLSAENGNSYSRKFVEGIFNSKFGFPALCLCPQMIHSISKLDSLLKPVLSGLPALSILAFPNLPLVVYQFKYTLA